MGINIMTKKADVVRFVKKQIKETDKIATVKDLLGKFKWCPASRFEANKQKGYYKYLLRMINK